jgi:hypothetical protein
VDKIQQEFEAWLKLNGRSACAYEDGEYFAPYVQSAWEGWQASRAALKVELPATCCRAFVFDDHSMDHDEYFEVDDIKQMLTDAGVSYE